MHSLQTGASFFPSHRIILCYDPPSGLTDQPEPVSPSHATVQTHTRSPETVDGARNRLAIGDRQCIFSKFLHTTRLPNSKVAMPGTTFVAVVVAVVLLNIAIIVFVIITNAVCAFRFWIRLIKGRQHKPIEYWLVFSLVMFDALVATQLQIFGVLSDLKAGFTVPLFVSMKKLFFAGSFFYLGCLWSLKISINLLHLDLTRRLKHFHSWAVASLYFLYATWPVLYLTRILGCLPVTANWALPDDPDQCPAMLEAWDFWLHLSIHIATDVFLFILPFPALLKISEPRLRIAVCGVYSLALVAVVVTIARVILLVTNADQSIRLIMLLSSAENAICIIVGVLPGISSTFTRRYVYGSSRREGSSGKNGASNTYGPDRTVPGPGTSHALNSRATFSIVSPSQKKASAGFIELEEQEAGFGARGQVSSRSGASSLGGGGSTDEIVKGTVVSKAERKERRFG
ncbi:hypothetical protein MKZ38_001183 [Zalerion maritima]|uniref:Rhodopsin domain-containing protein n=1 Tax=Zalerion maritima TaxID=339359 RepID=A0AAD5WX23_9PEZI|nr:hypothetical protein MKZ38_001183 [Zalerion maritima]